MRKRFVDGFHYDAHPMGMFVSALAALGTFYPESKDIDDEASRNKQIRRLIAKSPTLAAMCYRFSVGLPFFLPDNDLSYPANFLNMMWKVGDYTVDPVLERAMDVLFILPPTWQNAAPRRCVPSAPATPTRTGRSIGGGSALWSAARRCQRAVCGCSARSGVDNVDAFVESVKEGKGRLMGFGHRLQELRPVPASSSRPPRRVSRSPARTLLDALKLEEVALATRTSSTASSTPTSTSTPA